MQPPAKDFTDNQNWNMLIAASGGSFRQSFEWGEFQKALGNEVIRWQAENGALAAQIIRQPLPFKRSYFYIPRGPIITQNLETRIKNLESKPHRALLELIERAHSFSNQDKTIFLRVEPAFSKDHPAVAILSELGFIEVRFGVQPQETLLIDLTKSEDELLAAMHHKTRYNIRLAERHRVWIKKAPTEAFQKLWPLFEETAQRDKFSFHSKDYYQKMLEIMSGPSTVNYQLSTAVNPAQVRLWTAGAEGQTLAIALVGYFANTAIYLHGASSSKHRNLMAPYLLHWRIMQDAKQKGYTIYDFGGISEKAWPGVTRFKKGFGGLHFQFAGVFDLPFRRIWYFLYKFARGIRIPQS